MDYKPVYSESHSLPGINALKYQSTKDQDNVKPALDKVDVRFIIGCQGQQRSKYPEKFCRDSIDPGDIYSFQREQVNLDDSSLDLMKHAVSLIHGYNNEIWANAEIALFGPKLQIIFWSGERKNKFRISLDESCLYKARSTLHRKSLHKVFNEARDLLNEQPDCVLRNARLLVEGPDINVVLAAGDEKHKLIVVFTEFGDIKSSAHIDQHVEEGIPLRIIDRYSLEHFRSKDLCYSSDLMGLTLAAVSLLSEEAPSVWLDAQLELIGPNIHVLYRRGSRSTRYQIILDVDGNLLARNIDRSWYAKFNRMSWILIQGAKDTVTFVLETALRLLRRRL